MLISVNRIFNTESVYIYTIIHIYSTYTIIYIYYFKEEKSYFKLFIHTSIQKSISIYCPRLQQKKLLTKNVKHVPGNIKFQRNTVSLWNTLSKHHLSDGRPEQRRGRWGLHGLIRKAGVPSPRTAPELTPRICSSD